MQTRKIGIHAVALLLSIGIGSVKSDTTTSDPFNDNFIEAVTHCPDGYQFIKGQNTRDHCAPVVLPEDLLTGGLDMNGRDVCLTENKGEFSHYKYLFDEKPIGQCPEPKILLTDDGTVVELPLGTKTLFCTENEQPTYDNQKNIITCPLGAELVESQTANHHCAFYGEANGLDTNNVSVCENLGGFKKYIYRSYIKTVEFFDVPPPFKADIYQCDLNGDAQFIRDGRRKIIICEQEELPIYSTNDELISCPNYTQRIQGHSEGVPEHCAFLEGNLGYGIAKDLDANGNLKEIEICQSVSRGWAVGYVDNPDRSKTLLCEVEDFSNEVATQALMIKKELNCEEPNQEFINGSEEVQSHCAWTPDAPEFIREGMTVEGSDACQMASSKYETYSFNSYIFYGGVKTIQCDCEGPDCPDNEGGDRAGVED